MLNTTIVVVPLTEFSVHFSLLRLLLLQFIQAIMSRIINIHPNNMKVYLQPLYDLTLEVIPLVVNIILCAELNIYEEMVRINQPTYLLSLKFIKV